MGPAQPRAQPPRAQPSPAQALRAQPSQFVMAYWRRGSGYPESAEINSLRDQMDKLKQAHEAKLNFIRVGMDEMTQAHGEKLDVLRAQMDEMTTIVDSLRREITDLKEREPAHSSSARSNR